ncbi:hypothetical protein [Sulfitobacter sp. W074]|uniref:hypothetical protein n=1 Tax=Sulfitobacter sp. W074 TaxID=2867026 RepID=UPI0021A907DD|nr:hypothetical protein [Sulfitobacter sp. W074]UWR37699.1 hypothetical protein K3762_01245 [Sulfitobacter sp. W074]
MGTMFLVSVVIIGLFLIAGVIGFLRIVLSVPSSRWTEANQLSGSSEKVLYGEVQSDPNGLRDPRIAKGKVWDKATQNWLPQGKLSDEYLNGLAG